MGWYPIPAKQRFLSKIDFHTSENGCWLWRGSYGGFEKYGKHSYGRFYFMGKNVMAHRFSYEFIGGFQIEKGHVVDHLCKNPRCVNPNHLQSISANENTLRSTNPMALNSKRTECIRGHPLSGNNLYVAKDGHRRCLTCVKLRNQNFRKTGSYTLRNPNQT